MIQFPKPDLEQFFYTYSIHHFQVSQDEKKLVFSTNLTGKRNLWALDLTQEHPYPYQFSKKDESIGFIEFDPNGKYVLTSFDSDGDENHQIYALPAAGGVPQPLITGDENEKYIFSHLSKDGNRIYYNTSEGNPNFLNVRLRHLDTGTDELLKEGAGGMTQLVAVSEDEKTLVYIKMFANTYNNIYIQSEEEVYLTPDPEKIHVSFEPVFTNNDTLYFPTDYDSEYNYLAEYRIKEQSFSKVLEIENESITSVSYDKTSDALYIVTESGVVDKLYRYGIKSRELKEITKPFDMIDQIKVTESGSVYMLGLSSVKPANIYRFTEEHEWEQLTDNRVLGVSEEDMVEPETVTYQSFDGMEIESLFFRAKPENANGYTVFWPHGGPQAAEQKFFRAVFQCILNRGYHIFAPNFRGSTGYGSSFVKLVEQDWGYGPRLDNVEGIKWLFDQGITDSDHLFLVGGSYGGYMSLLLHGRHPEYFKAVVDIFGPSDLFTFVESVPDHWKPIMERWVGDPERDKERFVRDSPVTYLDTMTKPMLVIQGAKDPRVVKKESDQIVEKLRNKGREVEYLVLEDEGHGFSKTDNEIKVYKQMLEFLEKHQ